MSVSIQDSYSKVWYNRFPLLYGLVWYSVPFGGRCCAQQSWMTVGVYVILHATVISTGCVRTEYGDSRLT